MIGALSSNRPDRPSLLSKEMKVYEHILANGVVSRKEIQEHFGIEQRPASRIISKLKEKGYVISIGNARNTVYKATESRQKSGQIV